MAQDKVRAWPIYPNPRSWGYVYDEPSQILDIHMKPIYGPDTKNKIREERIKERDQGMLIRTTYEDHCKSGVEQHPNCCIRCRKPHSAEGYFGMGEKSQNIRVGICYNHKGSIARKVTWYPVTTSRNYDRSSSKE